MATHSKSHDRTLYAAGAIILSVVFFVAINVLVNAVFTDTRIDLTADRMFTLSPGTKEVLSDIREPILLRVYQSEEVKELGPFYATHANRVNELLDEYARLAGGQLIVERYDPQPFSPEEDLAVSDGVRGVQFDNSGNQLFFGIAGRNSTDDVHAIPFLSSDRANFLEYDLTRLVHDLANPKKPAVAVIGDVPLRGTQATRFRQWLVLEVMQQVFDVRFPTTPVEVIDEDAEILILAQPGNLDEQTLYAIDQFVMRGGRILAFVDPFAEALSQPGPGGAPPTPPGNAVTTMEPLFEAWGIEIPADKVVGDRGSAVRVRAFHDGRQVVTDYLPWLGLNGSAFTRSDVVTGNLNQVNLRSAGWIERRDGSEAKVEPLITTTPDSAEIPVEDVRVTPDPVKILAAFKPEGRSYAVAARVSGPARSAFPDGPPEAVEAPEVRAAHKAASDTPLNMIVVADADILADQNWAQVQRLLGQSITVPIANNGDFAVNALDNLSGSSGLISLRGRGFNIRPFEILQAMERDAEQQFRAKEVTLLEKIADTQRKIQDLQQKEKEGGVLLTAEQQETIETFRGEMLDLRRELRDVQHALRKDVDQLETWIRILNIWTVPVVFCVVAIVLAVVRRRRAIRYQAAQVH